MVEETLPLDHNDLVSPEATIAFYRRLRRERSDPYIGWLALVGELMLQHDCNTYEAERFALSNRHLRRWVERAINAGNPSRKRALAHLRYNGDNSLIEREGDSFVFRIPPPDLSQ